MEDTVRHLAKVLGAHAMEGAGTSGRFAVDGEDRSRLTLSLEAGHQRLMAVLQDSAGVARVDLDVAPITKVTEDPSFPGRVTLHIGTLLVHIDSRPTLAIEIVSEKV